MKIGGYLIIAALLMAACGREVQSTDLHLLEGYWEIESVEGSDGSSRTYTLNPTIDYLELQGRKGFRKKVQPQFDGSFITSDDATIFTIEEKNGGFIMVYEKGQEAWEERLVSLDSMAFSVINGEQITYYYRRYQPLVVTP